MFCKGCGKSVDTSMATCPHCGRDVDALSGGTGFWDLLDASTASMGQGGERAQFADSPESPVGEDDVWVGDGSGYADADMHRGISEVHARDVHPRRQQSGGNAPKSGQRLKLFAISAIAVLCIIAIALMLIQCVGLGASEEDAGTSQISLDAREASSDADDRQEANDRNAEPDADKRADVDTGNQEQDSSAMSDQEASDEEGRDNSQSGSPRASRYSTNDQEQEEGTANGQ